MIGCVIKSMTDHVPFDRLLESKTESFLKKNLSGWKEELTVRLMGPVQMTANHWQSIKLILWGRKRQETGQSIIVMSRRPAVFLMSRLGMRSGTEHTVLANFEIMMLLSNMNDKDREIYNVLFKFFLRFQRGYMLISRCSFRDCFFFFSLLLWHKWLMVEAREQLAYIP